MKVAVIGGLGVEHKEFNYKTQHTKCASLGGSAWWCALISRALYNDTTIYSRIGNDYFGHLIKNQMNECSIKFLGNTNGSTQHFFATLINGNVDAYKSKGVNPRLYDVDNCFNDYKLYDIIILAFNDPEIVYSFSSFKKIDDKSSKVANLSGSIIPFEKKYGIEMIQGFNIVTLNDHELDHLSKIKNTTMHNILNILSQKNESVFVTSKSRVIYRIENNEFEYSFQVLPCVVNSIGAGDAFATSLAIFYKESGDICFSVARAIGIAHKMCMLKNRSVITRETLFYE